MSLFSKVFNDYFIVTMENLAKCSLGLLLNEDFHLRHYVNKVELLNWEEFSNDEAQTIILRSFNLNEVLTNKFKNIQVKTVCGHHQAKILKIFPSKQLVCCDPLNKHLAKIRSSIREIKLEMSQKSRAACGVDLVPGKKLCTNCFFVLNNKIEEYDKECTSCADPFVKHRSKVTDGLSDMNEKFIEYLNTVKSAKFKSHQKLCNPCALMVQSEYSTYSSLKKK